MKVVLVGYRCTGKTTVAGELAKILGWKAVETDSIIEKKAGKKIAELVNENGWGFFRQLEKEVVKEVANMDKAVVAAGGGTVMDEENAESLKKHAVFVLLKAAPEVIRQRLKLEQSELEKTRPPLKGKSAIDEVDEVLRERMPIYEKLADFAVDTGKNSVAVVVKQILDYLKANNRGVA